MTLSYCLDRASGPGVLRGFTVFKTVHIDELGLVQSFRELTVECELPKISSEGESTEFCRPKGR